jgi:DNA helicase II / ATP-dependent DNA helicase PcrA
MRLITDIHLHSKYSRACSKELTLPNIAKACERKGIQIVGTSDFTHPAWRAHIGEELENAGNGAFALKGGRSPVRFVLSTEISCIYKRGGKTRRVHHVILMPDIAAVDCFIAALEKRGINLKADGRPIMGLDSEELIKIVLDASPDALLIPAHAWTPWFAVFGSQSGFDSLEECFGGMAQHVHAIETGLSSDPPMNRRLSALDPIMLVSNSDAHSLDKLGREANVFEMDAPSYFEMRRILVERDRAKFVETIEFFPEEGKYHADGHAACKYSSDPSETKRLNGVCPVCGKPLTIGVLNRVDAIADRPSGDPFPSSAVPFRYIIPLAELVGSVVGTAPSSKKVKIAVDQLLGDGRSEFAVLLDIPIEKLKEIASVEGIAEANGAMREGRVARTPGYDGVYGTIRVETLKKPTQASFI